MPRPYAFITNKEKRESFIREFVQILNDKAIELGFDTMDVEEIINNFDDPVKIEEFNKANEALERDKAREQYANSLLNGLDCGGNGRIYYHKIQIPNDNDPNKDLIDQKNQQMVEKYTNKDNKADIVREEMEKVFNVDPLLFYPENIDEAIETFEQHHDILNSCHVIDSTCGNNGFIPSGQIGALYEYYKSTIEDGGNVRTMIDIKASPLNLFLPENFNPILIFYSMDKLNDIGEKYPEFGLDPIKISTHASLVDEAQKHRELYNKSKAFFSTHKDFMLKNKIGGETFKKKLESVTLEQAEQSIQPGFDGAKYLKINPITSPDSKPFRVGLDKAVTMYNGFGKFIDGYSKDDLIDYFYDRKTGEYASKNKVHEAYFLYAMMKQKVDDLNFEVVNTLEAYLESHNKPLNLAKNYLLVAKGIVPYDAITEIKKDGFTIAKGVTDMYKSKVEVQNLKNKSVLSLRDDYKNGDVTRDISKNPAKFMAFAKAINEKYNSRSKFWKIFSPFAWMEKRLIADVKEKACQNGIDVEKYDNFINTDKNSYNKCFEECANSIKENAIDKQPDKDFEVINVDYFDKQEQIENEQVKIEENVLDLEANNEEIINDVSKNN